ncbi:hypothetical protein DE146DRAFT_2515 [Phaeosphaeria sp. MPI-PUGE-AT-0046c]|nr:hypothetical protein DE146DRAFT_2515 [Phaeosphaeria sp. MPI-PUGE-AT-0046c]
MANSLVNDSGAEQLPTATEKKQVNNTPPTRIPRRKLTLITITLLLNILHWSSFVCASTAIYQIASTPDDRTSLPSEILTLLSAFVTISYTYLHTIISLKQRIWMHQTGHLSAIKKSSYFATRHAISLCVFWLLTVGWDMILVARRPVCLPKAPDLQVWESGSVCHVARLGMAFAVIALVASLTLFGVLGTVRRPFEAHLYKHGYRPPVDPFATPTASRGTSPIRHTPRWTANRPGRRRRSISTQRSISDSDVETLDLSNSSPPNTIHAPSPQRLLGGFGTFTSKFTPPPIPPEFMQPMRVASFEALPPIFQPTASHRFLTRPPRLSGNVSTSGYVGPSVAPQYSASTWRALHPANPSPLRPASRSQPHLPNTAISHSARYSRSSVSLTRPRRLSGATPNGSVAWSSRSGSTGPEGRSTPAPGDETSDRRASAKEIAFAIMNGTPIPGTTRPETRGKGHKRRASAPDAPLADDETDRKAMGWKPQLADEPRTDTLSVPIKLHHLTRSSSAEFMSRFSPDSSPDNTDITPRGELERNIDVRSRVMKELPFTRQTLTLPVAPAGRVSDGARSSIVEAAAAMVSKMPPDLMVPKTRVLHSEPDKRRKMRFEDVKNKPLPKIAKL